MKVQTFKNISQIQEVSCSGASLNTPIDFLSLTLFQVSSNKEISTLRTAQNTCHIFRNYSSCRIDTGDIKNSVLKMLVSDLKGGEWIVIGCNVTSVPRRGSPQVFAWTAKVEVKSKNNFYVDSAIV